MLTQRRIAITLIALAITIAVVAAGVLWNEARKEVIFLCGNFSPGVSKQSVLRQLNTGHYIKINSSTLDGSEVMIASSVMPLVWTQCAITFSPQESVTSATLKL